MNKLEVGMYCKTDKGYIFKINEYIEHYTKGKRLGLKDKVEENFLLIGDKQCEIIESIDYSIPPCYPSDEELEKIKNHIVKSSYNIIDLIEVGDIIEEILSKNSNNTYNTRLICINNIEMLDRFKNNQDKIKSIVTKKQFEQMKYEVE